MPLDKQNFNYSIPLSAPTLSSDSGLIVGDTVSSGSITTGKILYSANGTTYIPVSPSTVSAPGALYQPTAPTNPGVGQIWIDSSSNNTNYDPNLIRRKTIVATGGQTAFTADLAFTDGYEQVFLNGLLLTRNTDYTTTNSIQVNLNVAAVVNDVIDILSVTNLNSVSGSTATTTTNTFTGAQTFTPSNAAITPITINGAFNQTADLLDVKNYSGSPLFSVLSNGNIGVGTSSPIRPIHIANVSNGSGMAISGLAPNLSITNMSGTDPNNSSMTGIFALSTSNTNYNATAGDLTIGLFGSSHNNIRIDANYASIGPTGNVIIQPTAGNVGIATTSPTAALHITGAASDGGGGISSFVPLRIQNTGTSQSFNWTISSIVPNMTNGNGSYFWIGQNESAANSGGFGFRYVSAGSLNNALTLSIYGYNNLVSVDANGSLMIGYTSTVSTSYKLQVNGSSYLLNGYSTSDKRYKENIKPLSNVTDIIKALQPVEFNWIQQEDIVDKDGKIIREAHNFPEGKNVGFVAQDVQKVLKNKQWLNNIVSENIREAIKDEDGKIIAEEESYLAISEMKLVPILVQAIKELNERLEKVEGKK